MSILNDLYLSRKPLAAFAIIGGAWACYFAQMPVIKAGLGLSDAAYGSLVFLAALGAVAAMVLAPLSERLAGPFSLIVGGVGVAIGFLWTGIALNPISFTLALCLASAGSGIIDVLANARISGLEEQSKRPLMNLNHAFYSFCDAGAAILTGFAREAGYSPVEVLALAGVVILGLCAIMYGPDSGDVAHEGVVSHSRHRASFAT